MRTRMSSASSNSDEVSGSQFDSDPPSDDNGNDDDNVDVTSSSQTSKRTKKCDIANDRIELTIHPMSISPHTRGLKKSKHNKV